MTTEQLFGLAAVLGLAAFIAFAFRQGMKVRPVLDPAERLRPPALTERA